MFHIEEHLRCGYFPRQYSSARQYIAGTGMDHDREQGTDCETSTISDLLNTHLIKVLVHGHLTVLEELLISPFLHCI